MLATYERQQADESGRKLAVREKNDIDDERRESIVNKTMLSARTNRIIGGVAPSMYLPRVETRAQLSGKQVDEILRSHYIDPDALRSDDFDRFFAERRDVLCQVVEETIGKPVPRDVTDSAVHEED